MQRLDDLRDPAAAAGWLHTIVRNVCLMRLRRPVRELAIDAPEDPHAPSDAEEALDQLAVRDWIWTALERLPDDQRVTIMLRYFGRHATYEEIAATLGIPVGTVRSRLNQAKARLADDLLRTASVAHHDHGKLLADRKHEWDAIVHEAYTTGAASLYVANCAPDVLVEAPSMAYRELGAEDQRRGVEDTVAAGVRLELTNLVASDTVTIWEGDYHNPPDDPRALPGDPHRGAAPPRRTDHQARSLLPTPSDADRPLTTNRGRRDNRCAPARRPAFTAGGSRRSARTRNA